MGLTDGEAHHIIPVELLNKNKFVKKFRLGVYGEGEDGVTIAEFV